LTPKGKGPGRISHHKCIESNKNMIITGGMQGDNSSTKIYVYDPSRNEYSNLTVVSYK
jgi:hypothetical protein